MGRWFALGLFATGLFLVAYWASEDIAQLRERRAQASGAPPAAPTPSLSIPSEASHAPKGVTPAAEPSTLPPSSSSEACEAEAQASFAAAQARDQAEALDTFLRRPVVAWVDDEALRARLETRARSIFASTLTPADARRLAVSECDEEERARAAAPAGPER